MTVEITLEKSIIKYGEDIIVLIKRIDSSDDPLSLTIHDESDDSIYAIGVSGNKNIDRVVIPSIDIEQWDCGKYFLRIFVSDCLLFFTLKFTILIVTVSYAF